MSEREPVTLSAADQGKKVNEPLVQNRTVHEMTSAKAEDLKVYPFLKAQADAIMRALGHQEEDEPFLNGAKAAEIQEAGGLHGKLARHAAKWLKEPDSKTTIPLTDDEHAQIAKLGVTL